MCVKKNTVLVYPFPVFAACYNSIRDPDSHINFAFVRFLLPQKRSIWHKINLNFYFKRGQQATLWSKLY